MDKTMGGYFQLHFMIGNRPYFMNLNSIAYDNINSWNILGTLDTISENQAKSVVGEIDTPSGSTPDYRGLLLKEYYKDLTAYRFDESTETILIIQIN